MIIKQNKKASKSILQVLKYGNPLLRKKVVDVVNFEELPKFVDKMFRTMYEESGIGLAANQVGSGAHATFTNFTEADNVYQRVGAIGWSHSSGVFSTTETGIYICFWSIIGKQELKPCSIFFYMLWIFPIFFEEVL